MARFGGVAWGPVAGYFALLKGLVVVAYAQTKLLQSDDLRHHLTVIVAFAVALTGTVGIASGAFAGLVLAPVFEYAYEAVLLLVIVVGVASTVRAHTRMVAIASLGVVGFGIALIFVLFAAPDLAITQFLVETLVVIIIALVLVGLPRGALREPDNGRIRLLAGTIAALGGALVAGLLLAVTSYPLDRTLTAFYEAASYPEANGRNIVNVILVDFRGIDTLAEITVLAVAASGVYALLRRARAKRADAARRVRRWRWRGALNSVILRSATSLLIAVLLLFSVFLLLRGHDLPGGGFIGGLLAASAVALYAIAYGPSAAARLLRVAPQALIGWGLAFARRGGVARRLPGASRT